MKKLKVLLASLALSVATATCSPNLQSCRLPALGCSQIIDIPGLQQSVKASEGIHPSVNAPSPTAITFDPEGTEMLMVRSSLQFQNQGGYIDAMPKSGIPSTVVFDEKGGVYFKNFISCLGAAEPAVWIKGVLEGDKITISLPQVAFLQQGAEFWAYAFDDTYTHSSSPTVPSLSPNQIVEFSYVDGVITQVTPCIISLGTNDGNGSIGFMSYGDAENVFQPFDSEPMIIPSGLQSETWAMTYSGDGRFVNVAFDGDQVYISNLCDQFPLSAIHGTIEDDKVVFPAGQYIGNFRNAYLIYFVPINVEMNDEGLAVYTLMDDATFQYDPGAKRMIAPKNMAIVMNSGTTSVTYDYLIMYQDIAFHYQVNSDELLTPPNPVDVNVNEFPEDYWDIMGYGMMQFTLPSITESGDLLRTEDLFYRIYVDDDEPIVFEPEDYEMLETPMEVIPYYFTDGSDFYHAQIGGLHMVYLKFAGYERIGVQSIYRVGGDEAVSDIVYNDGTISGVATGINDIELDNAGVDEETIFYDLTGRRVNHPSHGLFICIKDGKASKIVL